MLHLSFLKMLIVNVLLDDLNHTSVAEYFNVKFAGIISWGKIHINSSKTLNL